MGVCRLRTLVPFDVSTLRELFRIERRKTMACEPVEQLGGDVPDVVVYPAGGGTGLKYG